MNDLKGMQHSHSYYNLLANLGCIVLFEVIVVLDEFEKILSFDKFGDDVDVGLGLDALFEL